MSLLEELKELYPELSCEQLQRFVEIAPSEKDKNKKVSPPFEKVQKVDTISKKLFSNFTGKRRDEIENYENSAFEGRKFDSISKKLFSNIVDKSSSSDENENVFEQFVEKMKTPAICKKSSDFSSVKMKDFIVNDDSCSDDDDTSPTFYLQSLNKRIFQRINRPTATLSRSENLVVDEGKIFLSPEKLSHQEKNATSSVITFVPKNTPKKSVQQGRMKTFPTPVLEKSQLDPAYLDAQTFLKSLSSDRSSVPFVVRFRKNRQLLVDKLYKIFNRYVFKDKLPSSLSITWNVRMTTTAGYCVCKKDSLSQRIARIELSDKVCDSAERVRDTLIHELCHAAVWLLHGDKGHHGKIWQQWAKVSMQAFPDLPVISRCHSYAVKAKFIYRCTTCTYEIHRHSKSLDIAKNVCGHCKGKFILLPNKFKTKLADGTPAQTPKFALFVQANYSSNKQSQKHLSHKDIMRLLGDQFKQQLQFVEEKEDTC